MKPATAHTYISLFVRKRYCASSISPRYPLLQPPRLLQNNRDLLHCCLHHKNLQPGASSFRVLSNLASAHLDQPAMAYRYDGYDGYESGRPPRMAAQPELFLNIGGQGLHRARSHGHGARPVPPNSNGDELPPDPRGRRVNYVPVDARPVRSRSRSDYGRRDDDPYVWDMQNRLAEAKRRDESAERRRIRRDAVAEAKREQEEEEERMKSEIEKREAARESKRLKAIEDEKEMIRRLKEKDKAEKEKKESEFKEFEVRQIAYQRHITLVRADHRP